MSEATTEAHGEVLSDLLALSREDLNDKATDEGVEDAESLPNKEAVVEAILERRALTTSDEVPTVLEEVEYGDAPFEELPPLIFDGYWARIKPNARDVPPEVKGRDVVVLRAPLRKAALDGLSTGGYYYQLKNDKFLVSPRDGGEDFETTRQNFAAFGPNRGDLPGS